MRDNALPDLMRKSLRLKFEGDPEMREALLETRPVHLMFCSKNRVLGVGYDIITECEEDITS